MASEPKADKWDERAAELVRQFGPLREGPLAAALRGVAMEGERQMAFDAAGVLSYSLLTLRCELTMKQAARVITVVRSAIYDLDASRVGGKETK